MYVSANADVCDAFLKGYCPDGASCKKKHTNICQDLQRTGTCPARDTCKMKHPRSLERQVADGEEAILPLDAEDGESGDSESGSEESYTDDDSEEWSSSNYTDDDGSDVGTGDDSEDNLEHGEMDVELSSSTEKIRPSFVNERLRMQNG